MARKKANTFDSWKRQINNKKNQCKKSIELISMHRVVKNVVRKPNAIRRENQYAKQKSEKLYNSA